MLNGDCNKTKRLVGRALLSTSALLTSTREEMSKPHRKAYIEAVQCLRKLPAKSEKAWAPAAKTRFDDFVAIHVNQTMYIHGNGLFLTWHRYFVWAYEQALRNECGYEGYQPVNYNLSCRHAISTDSASTGTGSHTPTTSTSPPSLTAATPAWAATASSSHITAVSLVPGRSSFPPETAADVSRAAHSQSETSTSPQSEQV